MTKKNASEPLYAQIDTPLTGHWKEDKVTVNRLAMQPRTANQFYTHVNMILALFNNLTHGTPAAPIHPQRSGLLLKVHDELFPIAHFAKLYFCESTDVLISWADGNQNYDATVEDQRQESVRSNIRFLEVTTLQDKEDARQLEELSKNETLEIIGNLAQDIHTRKVKLLRLALEKKGSKVYPQNTALLVYTDEDRFKQFYIGMSPPEIDRKGDYGAVLNEVKHLLVGFSHVFIYSKHEFHCMLRPD